MTDRIPPPDTPDAPAPGQPARPEGGRDVASPSDPRARATAPPAVRRRRGMRVAVGVLSATALATAACAVGVASMWNSEAGTRWLLQHAPGVVAVDVRGALGGGDLRIGSLRVTEGGTQVDVAGLHVTGLDLRWHPHAGAWIGLGLARCDADAVRIAKTPSSAPPGEPHAPTSLRSPLALDVAALRVGTLTLPGAAPLRDVQAALSLGADQGRMHRVDHLRFGWERLQAEATVIAHTDAPLDIDVAIDAHDVADPAVDAAVANATAAATATTATAAPSSANPGLPHAKRGRNARAQSAATDTAPAASSAASSPHALPHWTATATLRGPLAGFDLVADLQGEARAGRAAPQAQASARVTPFATLPVGEVLLKTSELDLSALSAHAPATRLQGNVRVATTQPAALDVDLRNLAPAAWSAGGLPFSELTTHLDAPRNGSYVSIPALRLVLGDGQGAGGELRAQGRWEGGQAQVQLDLDNLRPARLDSHLGDWRVSGPLRAEFDRLPAPSTLWGAAPPPSTGASAAKAGTANVVAKTASSGSKTAAKPATSTRAATGSGAPPAAPAPDFAAWTVRLTGRLAGTAPPLGGRKPDAAAVVPPPMTLQLDASLRADALQLQQFELQAGAASVSAQGLVSRTSNAQWQGDVHAQWKQLDPGAWWRLADAGPLRNGTNLLNGSLALDLKNAPAAWQGLAAIRGRLDLALTDSQLGGLPLEGKATLDAAAAPWTLAAELHSAGNQAHVDGTLRPGNANADALAFIEQLHLSVDAPSLAMFTPFADGPPPAGSASTAPGPAWLTRGGARFDVQVSGGRLAVDGSGTAARAADEPSPPLRIVTQGEFTDWAGPSSRLNSLKWTAQGSTDPHAPLSATVSLTDAQWGVARVTHAQAQLSGTLAEHHLQLQGDAPVTPPAWLANLANVGNANGTRLDAQLDGRWEPASTSAPAWQGHLGRFDLQAIRPAAGTGTGTGTGIGGTTAVPGAANPTWVHLQPVDFSFSRDAAGQWQTLRVGAGNASFAGLTLAWQPSFWTAPAAPGTSAHWAFDAALSPFSVAQLLARAQPDLGWHGDLQMAAQLHAAFDGQWHVAGRLARTSGDLSVASDNAQDPAAAKQALGLTATLLQVKAEGAAWQADVELAGTRLGELAGHWVAEAPSPASLPEAGSPLRGNVKAHVADLNVWGAWLPPGWRLGGELQTELALSGRWGAPRVTGQVTAQQLAIRNALEGVYGHDGDLSIRLTGDEARIERFHLAGGNGTLSMTGSAVLGAAPVAKLRLQASRFQLLGRIDRKLVTSGDVDLQLGADAIKIEGKLGIDEGLFDISKGDAPTLDGDVDVVDTTHPSGDDAAAPVAPRTGRATTIALAVDLGEQLKLHGRGIDTSLRGALQISAPNGLLAVKGDIRTEGGHYLAYGQKLDVQRGLVSFTGPVNDPRLDILATRPNLDVTVGVAITGTALAPRVKLTSDPEMSDMDKLSWLMLGRAPNNLDGSDTALLQQAAMALLAGEDEGPTDQLLKRLGLTDFGVRQQTTTTDSKQPGVPVKQTVVALGRQISSRVYVGYERGMDATTGNWQLIYRIAQRLTVRAQSGEDNSVDMIYTWRWN